MPFWNIRNTFSCFVIMHEHGGCDGLRYSELGRSTQASQRCRERSFLGQVGALATTQSCATNLDWAMRYAADSGDAKQEQVTPALLTLHGFTKL